MPAPNAPSSAPASKAPPGKPLFVCMKWGTRYGADYANRLFAMCQRHMAQPFDFICFTDDTTGLATGIDARPLPPFSPTGHYAVKPWRKLSLWRADLGAAQEGARSDLLNRNALFLDLDVVITGPLEDFFTYAPEKHFVVIHNWTEPKDTVGNTSVFRFTVGQHPEIYEDFSAAPDAVYAAHRIEQRFIARVLYPTGHMTFWPKTWCRSFKEELVPAWPLRFFQTPKLPVDARIVVFHGKPDPDEALIGHWPAKGYKKLYKHVRPTGWIGQHWG